MMKLFISACFLGILSFTSANAQYAPQVGLPGCDAVNAYSSSIVGWATGCSISRGYMDIADPSLGRASSGDSTFAFGQADGYTVSLGDSGVAVLTFESSVYNGEGADFTVFENGFLDQSNNENAFLELAFVEVSSDGVHFFRFPANDLTQDTLQVNQAGSLQYQNARNINNLAGKYIAKYGTPFDLEELKGIAGLDINNVTHVRIVDVVGSIGKYGSTDSSGRKINDPYPTPFATGGFDLDAVGVMHMVGKTAGIEQVNNVSIRTFPNPATDQLFINIPQGDWLATITDMTGSAIKSQHLAFGNNELNIGQYSKGIYYLVMTNKNGGKWVEKIIKL